MKHTRNYNRISKLDYIKSHPHHRKTFDKLNQNEIMILTRFIQENDTLHLNEFEFKLNRFFLDQDKPKHWGHILEILSIINTLTGEQ